MHAGLLTHKRDGRDWRLRKFRDSTNNHHVDPNWETGGYIVCHPSARAAIPKGMMIFDVVYLNGKGVVRSAFQITGSHGEGIDRILSFNTFWYPGPSASPYAVLDNMYSTPFPTAASESRVEACLDGMKRAGYLEYLIG